MKKIWVQYQLKNGKVYVADFKVPDDWKKVFGVELVESQPDKTLSKAGKVKRD